MLFIVFEGIDGAGLTTHARLTERFLEARGIPTILTKEPTDGLIGGLIRACLRGEWKTNNKTLQLLFAADRSHHVESLILPALRKGKAVVSDRYLFSSLAYGSLSLDYEWLKTINSGFPLPHVTFILDLEPKEAVKRIREDRFAVELFEEHEKLSKVRRAYRRIAEDFENVFIIETDDSIEDVQLRIEKIITEKLKNIRRV